jgi:hypothetical protein
VGSNPTLSATENDDERGLAPRFSFQRVERGRLCEPTVNDPAGPPDRTRAARPEPQRGARAMDGPSPSHALLCLRRCINLLWAARPNALTSCGSYELKNRSTGECGRECLVMQRKSRGKHVRFFVRRRKKCAPKMQRLSGVIITSYHKIYENI